MNVLTIVLDGAAGAAGAANGTGGGGWSFIIMMVAIFAIMYFFMIRPQQKKQKQLANFQNSVGIGSEVVTQGGIYGTVRKVDEANNILYVEVANGVQIRIARNAVYPDAGASAPQK